MESEKEETSRLCGGSYRCLCEKYGLKPEECLFTDDVSENIKGVQACGFQGIVFESYEKTYPEIMKALLK